MATPRRKLAQPAFVVTSGAYTGYKCPICDLVLRNAVQTTCGHRFCEKCLEEKFCDSESIRCPAKEDGCDQLRKDDGTIRADYSARKDISKLDVFCENKYYGCPEVMQLGKLQIHLDKCRHQPMLCPNREAGCKALFSPGYLEKEKHLVTECLYRKEKCQHCENEFQVIILQSHEDNECPLAPVSCPNRCHTGGSMTREKLYVHLEQCPKQPMSCPFVVSGCLSMVTIELMPAHARENFHEHLKLSADFATSVKTTCQELTRTFQRISEEIRQNTVMIDDARNEISHLSILITTHREVYQDLKLRFGELNKRVIVAERKVDEHINAQNSQMTYLQDSVQQVSTWMLEYLSSSPARILAFIRDKVSSLKRRLEEQNSLLFQMDDRFRSIEQTSYTGTLVWPIDEYRSKKRDTASVNSELVSPPLFTDRVGYSMVGKIFLNGNGSGQGTHLSFFHVITRGDLDGILKWPFNRKITLSIMNQESGGRDFRQTLYPTETECYRRPLTDMNKSNGFTKFISHAELEARNRYIRNDVLFLHIHIDESI